MDPSTMQPLDDRKRPYDGSMLSGDMQLGFSGQQQPKRLRPEEIVPRDDPSKAICRLLLSRAQFSRIIGKGGQTIGQIRNSTGVLIKGSDIDEDTRLVVITGSLDQVLAAFDVIVELLHQTAISELTSMMNGGMMMNTRPMDHIAITLLLEHSKAGKAVGSKGAMMQTIKVKSNASSIRIDKEPIDVNGVSLRRLIIEGTLPSVRRAHMLVQELYSEPAALNASANYSIFTAQGGNDIPRSHFASPLGFEPAVPAVPTALSPNGIQLIPLPLPSLVNYGVQGETVRQLTDMKTYLWRHFALDLNVSREDTHAQASMGRADSFGGKPPLPLVVRTIETVIEARKSTHPQDVCFSIPRAAVGAVIGKGGQQLKDMQTDFGVRVFVEKEDFGGKRLVVLTFTGHGGEETETAPEIVEQSILQCQSHINEIVQDFLSRQALATASTDSTGMVQGLNGMGGQSLFSEA